MLFLRIIYLCEADPVESRMKNKDLNKNLYLLVISTTSKKFSSLVAECSWFTNWFVCHWFLQVVYVLMKRNTTSLVENKNTQRLH